jgi:hypothetical protein
MALDFNKQGNFINYPKKEYTIHDISELPSEADGKTDIPNGSLCTLCAKPNYVVYAYDKILKEWFPI